MHVLGVSCYFHDASACLVRGSDLIAAAEEERFTRVKHDSRFPRRAIDFCLKAGGISAADLDFVVFYERPAVKLSRILGSCVSNWPWAWGVWSRAIPIWLSEKLWMNSLFRRELGTKVRSLYCEHHLSHAASSFLVSPFEEAALLTLDGVGEWTTTAYGVGQGTKIRLEGRICFPHSIGLLYSALTAYLGFGVNDAEWKVMGLAGYGRPIFQNHFRQLVKMREDGSFCLNMGYFAYQYSSQRMFSERWCRLFGRPARKPESPLDQFHMDVAHSGQEVVEEIVLNMARALYERYRLPRLCLAGGVALNGLINWAIRERSGFKDVFVPPAPGDSGGALGAAFFVANSLLQRERRFTMKHAFWGPAYSDDELVAAFAALGVPVDLRSEEEILTSTAHRLAQGQIVGWFQGAMEFGARALGGRSILSDPRNPHAKDLINQKVKFREWFRPLAPAVLQEEAHRYFEVQPECDLPFMNFVTRVRPEYQDVLPAITHVDGTTRVQTVTEETNRKLYRLLQRFKELTGVPVLLNTSLNVRGEPIVCTPQDAYQTFRMTGLDALVAGNLLITEKSAGFEHAQGASRSIRLEQDSLGRAGLNL